MHDTAVFNALSNPVRRRILELLLNGPLSAGEIANEFELNRPTISEHVHVLKKSGLVTEQAEGRKNIFQLNQVPFTEVSNWIQPFENYWKNRVKSLEQLLDEESNNE